MHQLVPQDEVLSLLKKHQQKASEAEKEKLELAKKVMQLENMVRYSFFSFL